MTPRSINYGDTLTVECDVGYTLAGTNAVTCSKGTAYTAVTNPPVCTVGEQKLLLEIYNIYMFIDSSCQTWQTGCGVYWFTTILADPEVSVSNPSENYTSDFSFVRSGQSTMLRMVKTCFETSLLGE